VVYHSAVHLLGDPVVIASVAGLHVVDRDIPMYAEYILHVKRKIETVKAK
jgi:hypothetical protein